MFKERKRAKPTHLRHEIRSPSMNSRAAVKPQYAVLFHVMPAHLSNITETLVLAPRRRLFSLNWFQERSLTNTVAAISWSCPPFFFKQHCVVTLIKLSAEH